MKVNSDIKIKEEIKYSGMVDTFKKILKNEGILGFYKGLTPNLLKIFPTSGVFFIFYELTLSYLKKIDWFIYTFFIYLYIFFI